MSFSFETSHSSQLKFQPQSSLPFLSPVTSPSYISILSYNHSLLFIFCSSIYISPSTCTPPSIKNITYNTRSFFIWQKIQYWRNTNTTFCLNSRGMLVNISEFAGKDNNKIVSRTYFLLLSYATLYLFFCIFLGVFLTLCMKTYYTDVIVYHLDVLGKSFQLVTLALLYFWFILYMPARLVLNSESKRSSIRSNSVRRKYYQLKGLKVLLTYEFVTLSINKISGSENRHIPFNILKNESKEKFLTESTFCT